MKKHFLFSIVLMVSLFFLTGCTPIPQKSYEQAIQTDSSAAKNASDTGIVSSADTSDQQFAAEADFWKDAQVQQTIKNYLQLQVGEMGYYGIEGKSFCAYMPLGMTRKGIDTQVYVEAHCSVYTQNNSKDIIESTGSELPVALVMRQEKNGDYGVIYHRTPRQSHREDDVKEIFPDYAQKIILEAHTYIDPVKYPETWKRHSEYQDAVMKLNDDAKSYFELLSAADTSTDGDYLVNILDITEVKGQPLMMIDEIQMLGWPEDQKKIEELCHDEGRTECQPPNNFVIYNPEKKPTQFSVAQNAVIKSITFGVLGVEHTTFSIADFTKEFQKNSYSSDLLFDITIKNGQVTSMTQRYTP